LFSTDCDTLHDLERRRRKGKKKKVNPKKKYYVNKLGCCPEFPSTPSLIANC